MPSLTVLAVVAHHARPVGPIIGAGGGRPGKAEEAGVAVPGGPGQGGCLAVHAEQAWLALPLLPERQLVVEGAWKKPRRQQQKVSMICEGQQFVVFRTGEKWQNVKMSKEYFRSCTFKELGYRTQTGGLVEILRGLGLGFKGVNHNTGH